MVSLDPSVEELAAIVDFATAAEWAGLAGEASDAQSPRGSLLALLGAEGNPGLSARLIGTIPEPGWNALVSRWRCGEPLGMPSAIQQASAMLIGRACRLRIGAQETRAAMAAQVQVAQQLQQTQMQLAQAQTGQLSSATRLRVKLCQVMSQSYHDSVETELLSQTDVDQAYARYEVIFGVNKMPPQDETPTIEQMSAFKFAMRSGDIYADFSVFGPYGNRTLRKLRLSGQVFDRDGCLRTIELVGPTSFDVWLYSAQVLKTLDIMFDAMDFGTFNDYVQRQQRYHTRYGARCWHLQYQTDVRTRSEKASRILAKGTRARNRMLQQQQQHPLDPARPWQWVFEQLEENNERWWKEEFEELATLLLNKIASDSEVLGGDAPVAKWHGAPANASHIPDGSKGKRKASRGSYHSIEGGLHLTNRKKVPLCEGFNEGTCQSDRRWPGQCPIDWNKAHQCNKCLEHHSASSGCGKSPAESSRSKYSAGSRGKGGGKGRGKQKH